MSIGQQAYSSAWAASFFGLAAHAGLESFPPVLSGCLVAVVLVLPAGLPACSRLRGAYFAIGSWVGGRGVPCWVIANHHSRGRRPGPVRERGAVGRIPSRWWQSLDLLCALPLVAVATFLEYALLRSRWGLALTAARQRVGLAQPRRWRGR
ncbi:MAG: hypothetical protein IPO57_14845 [Rhodocyclales bacterium]|nr:hypothetical protein [Rhodocyclales bacterium]